MPYASPSDYVSRYGLHEIAMEATPDRYDAPPVELLQIVIDFGDVSGYSTDEVAAATAAVSRLSQALVDAETEMNIYLAKQYVLPFETTPTVLPNMACTIGRYNLFKSVPDDVRSRYKDTISLLAKIGTGDVELDASGTTSVSTQVDTPMSFARPRVFSDDTLSDF